MGKQVIHLYGAAGSGTSATGKFISDKLGFFFMDTDDYFWEPTDPPYTTKRKVSDRLALMKGDIAEHDRVVISGSLVGWGDELIPCFTLAVRVETVTAVRMERLEKREREKFGDRLDPGGDMYEIHRKFMDWAAAYDTGDLNMRSRAEHDEWQKQLQCPQVSVDGSMPFEKSLEVIRRCLSLPEQQAAEGRKAIAAKTVVSLREKPSEQVCLDDELLYGMAAEILEEVPDADGEEIQWVHIRTEYRYEAYCRKDDLLTEESRLARWEQGGLCVVMQSYADVLSEPKVQGICLESIPRGGRLIRIGEVPEREGWIQVELADGRRGYTRETFLGPYYPQRFTENEDAFRSRLTEIARSYLGTQYRWGGKSPLGIDCSGLTSMCYMLCGVYIYRNARMKEGFPIREIRAEEKKPGDLLFFPGHIAMYLGNDRYIHSTGMKGSDGVVINSLNPAHEDFRPDLWEKLESVGSMFL